MPKQERGVVMEELLDEEELELFLREAEYRGMSPAQLTKFAIQQTITERTRPRTMTGPLQAFRRR